MHIPTAVRRCTALAATLLAACAGSGEGLDANGQPPGAGGSSGEALSADFQSIQDNVFTPICTRCHEGAAAPEGLQLDAAHSYALLVGVPSNEDSSLERVKPGDPDRSYLVLKLQGAPGIVGAQMPFGGPYLPQSTINVIRQWITNGAQASPAQAASAAFAVAATSPPHAAVLARAPHQLLLAFNREVDYSLVNAGAIALERDTPAGPLAFAIDFQLAPGNPAAVLITPRAALPAGHYRLRARGTGPAALADLNGQPLGVDAVAEFTVAGQP